MGSLPNPFHHFAGILLIIWLFFSGCGGGSRSSNSEPNHLTKVSVSGKLAQAYVGGATLIADKKDIKFIAPKIEDAPAKCKLKIAISTAGPECPKLLESGG